MKGSKRRIRNIVLLNQQNRGVALVIVLAVVALATLAVVSFFEMARTEHNASYQYSKGLHAQQVAEQAVNIVIAQVRMATTTKDAVWASQPGAIRTWKSAEGSNETFKGFKLYSDDKMVELNENIFATEDFSDLEGDQWIQLKNQYVDLNEPVIRGNHVYYPIVDPSAAIEPRWPKPLNGKERGIEGFEFNQGDHKVTGSRLSTRAADTEHLPLPVKWIYQLEDGTLGHLSDGKFTALTGTNLPTKNNQIAARFAFWTDDETSKLNLNVNAGGLTWDTPRAGGLLDRNMGQFQPAQNEWQRYPGHPATTSIAPVLAPGISNIAENKNAMELIYSAIPRIVGGGSESGTRQLNLTSSKEKNGLQPDTDRLYPSVHELAMLPNREPTPYPQANGRPAKPENVSRNIEQAQFFLTTHSRSPELTLFNTPRITTWPIHLDTSLHDLPTRTKFDQLIAYCSTLGQSDTGKFEYFFKRKNADSTTYDFSSPEMERNRQLWDYMVNLMSKPIPKSNQSFADKYGTKEVHNIATLIFDYIRCTNLHDDNLFGEGWQDAFYPTNSNQHRTYTNPRKIAPPKDPEAEIDVAGKTTVHKGHGQVLPIIIERNGHISKGFGRFFTLLNMSIQVHCVADGGRHELPQKPALLDYHKMLGGGYVEPRNPGYKLPDDTYENRDDRPAFSNIPPMHSYYDVKPSLSRERQDHIDQYPDWLLDWMDSFLITEKGAWQTIDIPPKRGDKPPENLKEKGDWRQRHQWRKTEGRAVYWQEVLKVIAPAFDRDLWNRRLNYNRVDPSGNVVSIDRKVAKNHYMRLGKKERLLQASLLFSLFCPSQGWVPINPDMSLIITLDQNDSQFIFENIDIGGGIAGNKPRTWLSKDSEREFGRFLDSYNIEGQPVDARETGRSKWTVGNKSTPMKHGNSGVPIGPGSLLKARTTPLHKKYDPKRSDLSYAFVTRPFRIKVENLKEKTLKFKGGPVSVEIFGNGTDSPHSAPSANSEQELVQTIQFSIPDFEVKPPFLHSGKPGSKNNEGRRSGLQIPKHYWGFKDRYPGGRDISDGSGWGYKVSVGNRTGDLRISAGKALVSEEQEDFVEHPYFPKKTNEKEEPIFSLLPGINYHSSTPIKPYSTNVSFNEYGDFDNGVGLLRDGAYINKPDEGNFHNLISSGSIDLNAKKWKDRRRHGELPYFVGAGTHEAGGPSYFSPNRITSGPGMFGSLPSGILENKSWQTLLFRPACDSYHPGAPAESQSIQVQLGTQGGNYNQSGPADHHLLDLFWMPSVEPYAISETFSTSGKINLNYQILPFKHIKRNTGLHGVFRPETMVLIPTQGYNPKTPSKNKRHKRPSDPSYYARQYKHNVGKGHGYHWKNNPTGGVLEYKSLRGVIHEDSTLEQFERLFQTGNIFRSASQICEIHLVPQQLSARMGNTQPKFLIDSYQPSIDQMEDGSFWRDHALVGDNSRERPYANIYSRVTTKSNTFKVHYRGQVLKQGRGGIDRDYSIWDDDLDSVISEYRGSSIIERFIDPNDPNIPDYATDTDAAPIGEFYQFRVFNSTRFSP